MWFTLYTASIDGTRADPTTKEQMLKYVTTYGRHRDLVVYRDNVEATSLYEAVGYITVKNGQMFTQDDPIYKKAHAQVSEGGVVYGDNFAARDRSGFLSAIQELIK